MINVTRLYNGVKTPGDSLRYPEKKTEVRRKKPVVVWTMTRCCNLRCVHCYSDSGEGLYPGELTREEAREMLKDLASFRIPALLLSGGEPLTHPYFFELTQYASFLGIPLTLSTNGTLIDSSIAKKIKETGFKYVGISFDGLGQVNDCFRGKKGAFESALKGLRYLKATGQRVGLRFTLTRRNFSMLPDIFDLIRREGIDRVCFYHLVYSGRGSQMTKDDLIHQETRTAMDLILKEARNFEHEHLQVEVLTVDNHADGVYLYLKLRREDPDLAQKALECLLSNGGGANSSGVGIANIDSYGNVHPDQFWTSYTLGNVRERPFNQIWTDTHDPLLAGLRNRLPLLKGRCGSCQWKKLCGGAFRVRALQFFGDPWAEDPACYLTEEEIQ